MPPPARHHQHATTSISPPLSAHPTTTTTTTTLQRIYDELAREEGAFAATLERGQKLLDELLAKAAAGGKSISGQDAFMLYDTYGFPLELTQELAEAQGLQVSWRGLLAAGGWLAAGWRLKPCYS
jgi:alanyl-tRNA synthetase